MGAGRGAGSQWKVSRYRVPRRITTELTEPPASVRRMKIVLLSRRPGVLPAVLGPGVSRLIFVEDAAAPMEDAPFVARERCGLEALGYELERLRLAEISFEQWQSALASGQAVYLASGLADVLLQELRRDGMGEALVAAARGGLPVVGASAGSMVLGSSIRSGVLMDGATSGVVLDSLFGLGLVDAVVVPHADGQLPPYPPELIARVRDELGEQGVVYLRDDQALVVDESGQRLVSSM